MRFARPARIALTSQPSSDEAGLEAFLDKIVVERLAVFDDAHDAPSCCADSTATTAHSPLSAPTAWPFSDRAEGLSTDAACRAKSVLVPYSGREDVRARRRRRALSRSSSRGAAAPKVLEPTPAARRRGCDIDFHGVKAHFTTDNVNEPPQSIVIKLKDGPFRHLHGRVAFRALAPRTPARSSSSSPTSSRTPLLETAHRPGVRPHREHLHRRVRAPRGSSCTRKPVGYRRWATSPSRSSTRHPAVEAIAPVRLADGRERRATRSQRIGTGRAPRAARRRSPMRSTGSAASGHARSPAETGSRCFGRWSPIPRQSAARAADRPRPRRANPSVPPRQWARCHCCANRHFSVDNRRDARVCVHAC